MNTRISRTFGFALLALLAATGTAFAQDVPVAQEDPLVQDAPAVETATIGADELISRIEAQTAPTILDVRTPEEFAEGHIRGAINIPFTELEARASELEMEGSDELVVYCQSGRRAGIAEATLAELGFTNVRDLDGHIAAWKEADRPLE